MFGESDFLGTSLPFKAAAAATAAARGLTVNDEILGRVVAVTVCSTRGSVTSMSLLEFLDNRPRKSTSSRPSFGRSMTKSPSSKSVAEIDVPTASSFPSASGIGRSKLFNKGILSLIHAALAFGLP